MVQNVSERNSFPVGTVLKGLGLKGDVKIHSLLEDTEILDGVHILIASYPDGRTENLELDRVRARGGKVVLGFKGIKDRAGADALRGAELSIAREDLPALAAGEYYLSDLVGYTVLSDDGIFIGVVKDVWDLPANEVLQVIGNDREVLVPLIDEVIKEIRFGDQRIVITVMEGLLD
ncbi:MAG: 16S rRNA processing protein RimM [Fidelibacterota bacterium]|nr:MAG: 16S rRNA processing protein RimM [Candidatus Neomarinimicrobiota bacterium]